MFARLTGQRHGRQPDRARFTFRVGKLDALSLYQYQSHSSVGGELSPILPDVRMQPRDTATVWGMTSDPLSGFPARVAGV